MAELTPAQRRRLAKVSSEAFEALRIQRAEILRALVAEGVQQVAIASELGVSKQQIAEWMRRPARP